MSTLVRLAEGLAALKADSYLHDLVHALDDSAHVLGEILHLDCGVDTLSHRVDATAQTKI